MSEKMRTKRFMELCALLPAETNWGDSITPDIVEHIYQAALRTHEDGVHESEAGAILYMAKNLHSKSYATSRSKAEAELFLLQSGLKVDGREAAVIPLYLAPPSAPAIETAYMKGYEDGIAGKPAKQD